MPLEMTSPKKNGEREEAKSSASALRAAVIAVRDAAATKLMILFSEKPFVRQFHLPYRGIIAAENRLGEKGQNHHEFRGRFDPTPTSTISFQQRPPSRFRNKFR